MECRNFFRDIFLSVRSEKKKIQIYIPYAGGLFHLLLCRYISYPTSIQYSLHFILFLPLFSASVFISLLLWTIILFPSVSNFFFVRLCVYVALLPIFSYLFSNYVYIVLLYHCVRNSHRALLKKRTEKFWSVFFLLFIVHFVNACDTAQVQWQNHQLNSVLSNTQKKKQEPNMSCK